ncbi:hypothetical protein C7S13_3598 [Burkholderia cepacia]|nr:hypothetical protein [Burkholderia cepacia]
MDFQQQAPLPRALSAKRTGRLNRPAGPGSTGAARRGWRVSGGKRCSCRTGSRSGWRWESAGQIETRPDLAGRTCPAIPDRPPQSPAPARRARGLVRRSV